MHFSSKNARLLNFCSFLVTISIQIEKRVDGVLGIQTRGPQDGRGRRNQGVMAAILEISISSYELTWLLLVLQLIYLLAHTVNLLKASCWYLSCKCSRELSLCKRSRTVWPDWAIYCTLGNFSQPVATIILPKSPTFLGNFCKGVKIFLFSSKIIFGQLYRHLATFSGHTGYTFENCTAL